MAYRGLTLALVLTAAAPAHADRRIINLFYSPERIYKVTGHYGIQTMIEFGADEKIENVALGDSAVWQVTPNKRANLIFVKPLFGRSRTNMTVVTDKRRYLFALTSGDRRGPGIFDIHFTYPEPIRLVAETKPAPQSPPPPPLPINTKWVVKGDKRLIPARIYDDSQFTYIAWSSATELPAVLTLNNDGNEGPVNYTVRGDYLVIDGVAPRYILRMGKAMATLTNMSPAPLRPVPARAEDAKPMVKP